MRNAHSINTWYMGAWYMKGSTVHPNAFSSLPIMPRRTCVNNGLIRPAERDIMRSVAQHLVMQKTNNQYIAGGGSRTSFRNRIDLIFSVGRTLLQGNIENGERTPHKLLQGRRIAPERVRIGGWVHEKSDTCLESAEGSIAVGTRTEIRFLCNFVECSVNQFYKVGEAYGYLL